MTDKYPHKVEFTDAGKKTFERIAALLDLDDWNAAIAGSGAIALECAEQVLKGNSLMFCKPELIQLYEDNPEFFKALCEDGVVEWLTPLVLAKSSTLPPSSP